MENKIPTYIINLEKRSDRKSHISNQFNNRNEFDVKFVPAIEHKIGAIGLWKTIRGIIEVAKYNNLQYILICEDDHQFTDDYEYEILLDAIENANYLHADLLLGGVSYFQDAVEFGKGLFWLNSFTGFQFSILYNRFFDDFLNISLMKHDNIDIKMKDISDRIYCIYPFISIQKEFGYSDVTSKNEKLGVVDEYYIKTSKRLETLTYLKKYYNQLNQS